MTSFTLTPKCKHHGTYRCEFTQHNVHDINRYVHDLNHDPSHDHFTINRVYGDAFAAFFALSPQIPDSHALWKSRNGRICPVTAENAPLPPQLSQSFMALTVNGVVHLRKYAPPTTEEGRADSEASILMHVIAHQRCTATCHNSVEKVVP